MATDILDAFQRHLGNGPKASRAQVTEVVTREPRRLVSPMKPLFSVVQRAAQVVSLLGTGAAFLLVTAAIALVKAVFWLVPRRRFVIGKRQPGAPRVIVPAFLVAVFAASGYYVYRYSAQPEGGLYTAATRTPSPAVPTRIGIPATVHEDAATMTTRVSGLSSPVAPPTDFTTSQFARGSTSTTVAASTDTDAHALAQSAATVQSKSSTNVPVAAESRPRATQTAVQRVVPMQTISNPSTATDPNPTTGVPPLSRGTDARVSVLPDALHTRVCTDAVAALGLCNLNTSSESSTNVPSLAESSPGPTQRAGQRVAPMQATSNPSTATDPDLTTGAPPQSRVTDARVSVLPDAPLPRVCTDAVAALGLCNLSTSGQSK
jgi:hypothetical protein